MDPPWLYKRNWNTDPKNGGITYPVMTMQDIGNLAPYLDKIMAKDAHLFVWMTGPKLKEQLNALDTLTYYKFNYVTLAFTWLKRYKDGKVYSGLGSHTNSNQEYVALFRRGKCLPRLDKTVKQPVESVPEKHSEKPLEVHHRIERLYGPNVNKIELFARKRVPGWDCLGNELSGLDIKQELQNIIDGTWIQS